MDIPGGAAEAGGNGEGWLVAATGTLRKAVDDLLAEKILHGREPSPPSSDEPPPGSPTASSHAKAAALERVRIDNKTCADAFLVGSNATEGGRRGEGGGEGGAHGDRLPVPALPPRPPAPSLYTLLSPSIKLRQGRCSDSRGHPGVGEPRVFPEIQEGTIARLSSARSVFGLRAMDVLAAFSPSPSSASISPGTYAPLRLRHTAPGWVARSPGPSRGVIRRRLRTATQPTGAGGLGQASDHPGKGVSSVRPGQAHAVNHGAADEPESDGANGEANPKKHPSRKLPPPGRRLSGEHELVARRRRCVGRTDAMRVKHAGRNLWFGVAAGALAGVLRTLDDRSLAARQRRELPRGHVEQLLGAVDRLAFAESQVLGSRATRGPIARHLAVEREGGPHLGGAERLPA